MESIAQKSVIAAMRSVVVLTGHVNVNQVIEVQLVTKVSLTATKQ